MSEIKEIKQENLETVTGGKQQPSEPKPLASAARPISDLRTEPLTTEQLGYVAGGDSNPMEIRREEFPNPAPDDLTPKPGSGLGVKADIPCPHCGGTNVLCVGIYEVGQPALYICPDCRKNFKA